MNSIVAPNVFTHSICKMELATFKIVFRVMTLLVCHVKADMFSKIQFVFYKMKDAFNSIMLQVLAKSVKLDIRLLQLDASLTLSIVSLSQIKVIAKTVKGCIF